MSEKKNDKEQQNPDCTAKVPIASESVELTQTIKINDEEIIDKNKKEALISSIIDGQKKTGSSGTHLGEKSVFTKKRITDDYVKSNSLLYTINSIPPLEDDLELQDVNYNYELKDQFSEGAQGIIRTAFDKSLKREIVVKSLKGDDTEERSQKSKTLFVSEARIMAQLDHPSIVPLYGLHSGDESKLHLAMKHIHGKTLQQYLLDIIDLYKNEGVENFDEKRSMATRIEYLIKVCEAIDYAHCKGVIHRDIKSENIMIGNYGEVYVMDWGLACLFSNEASSAKTLKKAGKNSKRELVGTPCYMAPELIVGGAGSRQSDIFALGMVFFEIVTLQRAAGGKTVNEVFKSIINRHYCPFNHRFLKRKLPNDLKAIFEKAIYPHMSRRYKTANEMAEDLRLYLMREETVARPDNILRKCMRTMINHKMITSIVILSLLLCFAGVSIYSLYNQNILVHQQKEREGMLANFQYDVSKKAGNMESIFAHFKSKLANLGYSAGDLFSKPISISPPIFDMKYYEQASTAPWDYVYSPAYDRKISLNLSAFKLGPDVKHNDNTIRRIAPIAKTFGHIMFTSDKVLKGKTLAEAKKIIYNKGVILSLVYIGLENGSMLCYPGGNISGKDFDPRKLKWYKKALTQKHSFVWSEPYIDVFSSKLVMSCNRCVYNNRAEFQGVVGMDISLDYIQKQMFTSRKNSGIKEYLLTKDGKIIISSEFSNKKIKTKKNTALILNTFSFNKDFQKALEENLVLFEAVRNNTKYIFVFNKLPSMEYYYLQQVSEERLRKDWELSHKKK
jgi:eukaryotic-like serine/threonine-protein kinase